VLLPYTVLNTPFSYRYLATCSADATIKIWKVSPTLEFTLDKTLTGHQRWVWDAAWSTDSAYLVTGEPASCMSRVPPLADGALQLHPTTSQDCGTSRPETRSEHTTDTTKRVFVLLLPTTLRDIGFGSASSSSAGLVCLPAVLSWQRPLFALSFHYTASMREHLCGSQIYRLSAVDAVKFTQDRGSICRMTT